ncbi:unnamed protein product [Angiostrongylus costaricensis]|uniref:Retinol dehydrogenase 14 n=1 Tax=Angiostrongylus costaricensis TaxID=334426 RepID=A0A0R3PRB0_ANGCS|nr:unnamed protein product [Angiostrongylus costaricensis]
MTAIKGHRRRRAHQSAEYQTSWINNSSKQQPTDESGLRLDTQDFDQPHKVPRLDILICNAGVLRVPVFTKTVDGFEKTWQCNYLGHFLLVELLLPLLSKSQDGRIINVSSVLYEYADSVRFDVVNDSKRYGGMIAYSRSKMAQVMYTRHLAKLLEDRNLPVTAAVCHPGNVDTNILRESGYSWLSVVFRPIVWFILKTENDGAQMPLYLALSEKSQKSNGQYFRDFAVHEVVEKCKQSVACETLYEESRQAVGLSTLSRKYHQQ